MAKSEEIHLGNNWHTLYSDEEWFLIVPPGPSEPFLEGRFQTDAPDRTGWPGWTATDFCVQRDDAEAICQLPLKRLPNLGDPNRFASITDAIWKRAIEECAKLATDPP
jgi:hypothetical protein